ncbi:MAG: hypothetical protein Kow00108_19950 [Calditrichia bacterium]
MILNEVTTNIIQKIKGEVLKPNMTLIPLAYIMTRNIPDSVKHYFNQEVENWLREEEENIVSSDRFDYEMPEVKMLLDQIFDILKNTANFSHLKFNQILERAVKLEANYLIKPHTTLRQFLFKDAPVISTIQVYDTLKYFTHLNYYKDALTQYFNKKYMKEITEPQFAELIRQIDKQVFTKNPNQAILKITKAIISFMNNGRTPSDSIPLSILLEAFTDRELVAHSKVVNALMKQGMSSISIGDLEQLLTTGQMPRQKKEAIEPAEKSPQELMREKLKAKLSLENMKETEEVKPDIQVEEIEVSKAPPVVVAEPEEEDIEEEFEEEEEEEVIETPSAQPTSVRPEDQLADLVAQKLAADSHQLESLQSIISKKDQKKFIKKLFKKNSKAFDKLIKQLDDTSQWKQASLIIDQYFYDYGVNPYSKEAIEFSDLVYTRYFAKEKEMKNREFD